MPLFGNSCRTGTQNTINTARAEMNFLTQLLKSRKSNAKRQRRQLRFEGLEDRRLIYEIIRRMIGKGNTISWRRATSAGLS